MTDLAAAQADTYALSMSYDPTGLTDPELLSGEFALAAQNTFGRWVLAVDQNVGGQRQFVFGPWNSSYALGTYGVDTNTATVWAVLNYTASFAASTVQIAEPGYVAGDFHQHTLHTDGSLQMADVFAKDSFYGLDWWANSEHGGNQRSAYRWKDVGGYAIPSGLADHSWGEVKAGRIAHPTKTVIQGLELNCPGHEHVSTAIIADQFPADTNLAPIAECEYRFDGGDGDTSGGPGGIWTGKSTVNDHAKATNAVAWLQANYPKKSWFVPAHPERANSYTIAHFRDFNNVGPDVAFGFESMTGHQKSSGRGGYGTSAGVPPAPAGQGGTYGGTGVYAAQVGGLWDAMLAEGRGWWLFASSDFHNTGGDFWPGEYQKTYTYVPDTQQANSAEAAQVVADGLRSGNSWVVEGDLIDSLAFSVSNAVMGQTCTVPQGAQVTISIRVHDPVGPNFNTYSSYTNPALDHIDVIAGSYGSKIAPFLGDGVTPNPAYSAISSDARVIARFDAVGGVTDANGITSAQWTDQGDGWRQMTLSVTATNATFLRLRGANLGLNVANQTDGAGNPLADSLLGNNTAAMAFDDLWFYSNPIFVRNPTPNVAPTVSISSPTTGGEFVEGVTIPVLANATDADGAIAQVDFYVDGALLGSDTTYAYQYNWANAPTGTHSLVTVAIDNEGLATTSTVVSVTVVAGSTEGGSGLDTPALRFSILSGTDDTEEVKATGFMDLASSDLELIMDGSKNQLVGMRFANVVIPQGAKVLSAYIQFTCDEIGSKNKNPFNVTVKGEASDNASSYTATASNMSARACTVATVAWSNAPDWQIEHEAGVAQRTPDIAAVVQEIVSRPGWAEGNALALMMEGEGARVAEAYEGEPTMTPELVVVVVRETRVAVTAGTDDVEELKSNGFMDIASSDLELIQDGSKNQLVGMRFNSIDIPQGTKVLSAYLQFTCDEMGSKNINPFSVTVFGEATNSAVTYTTAASNMSTRARTVATVAWSNAPDWLIEHEADAAQRTPDLSAVVQEIINRTDWVAGNSLALMMEGQGGRCAEAFEGEPTMTPRLVIQTSVVKESTFAPAASSDDAEENNASGAMDLTSSDIEVIQDKTYNQTIGIRCPGVNLPAGALLVDAYLQFTCDEMGSKNINPFSVTIRGEAVDNAETFTTTVSNIAVRARTTATTAWSNAPDWQIEHEAGLAQRTPSLLGIVREILARPGWENGNAMAFLINGQGGRCAEAFDGEPTMPPKLVLVYAGGSSTSVNTAPTVSLTSPLNGAVIDEGQPVSLSATASDNGSVSNVEFYVDGASVTNNLTAPYTATWTAATVGGHALTAVAWDDTGLASTSATVNITVVLPTPSISFGVTGTVVQTLGTIPSAMQWATASVGVNKETYITGSQLDAAVQTLAASAITNTLVSDTVELPLKNGLAVWSSYNGGFIQTCPTSIGATLLKATLVNQSGTNLSLLRLSYLYTVVANVVEDVPGQHVFYSLTGAAGSWTLIPALSGLIASTNLDVTVSLSQAWTNGATLYLLWADDNDVTNSPDTYFQIDNFVASPGVPPVPFSVALTTPATGALIAQGSELTLAATASGEGPATNVDFYVDGALASSDATVPYTATWTASTTGIHTLKAVAQDAAGHTTTSAVVTVTVTLPVSTAPWKFGVMSDTQWTGVPSDPVNNPNDVAVSIINQLNPQFINAGVQFVVQVGDLTQNGNPADVTVRAAAATTLYNAGIGFFPLRGNHEGGQTAGRQVTNDFPQTQGHGANVYAATNFTSASPELAGLSYSFDYNNSRMVVLDQFTRLDGTGADVNNAMVDQVPWIGTTLSNRLAGTHAFVFSHKNLIGENHTDCLFGATPAANVTAQNQFIGALAKTGVRYTLSGHDHVHQRSLIASPDALSSVEEIICGSDSSKFYTPDATNAAGFAGQKYRETSLAQDLYRITYYVGTVDGPRFTMDYYASDETFPSGNSPAVTPTLHFNKRETFGYSLNGQRFLVPQGGSYTIVSNSIATGTAYGETYKGTTARILNGVNGSTAKDYNNRAFTREINLGWAPSPTMASDVLTLWGMADLGTNRTDTYVLTMSYDPAGVTPQQIDSGNFGLLCKNGLGNWVNAVKLNAGGTVQFVLGAWNSGYTLGTYGVDTTTHTVWAVVNHASNFAAGYEQPPQILVNGRIYQPFNVTMTNGAWVYLDADPLADSRLRATQRSLGYREVTYKSKLFNALRFTPVTPTTNGSVVTYDYTAQNAKSTYTVGYWKDKDLPVMVGPDGKAFITDGHHTTAGYLASSNGQVGDFVPGLHRVVLGHITTNFYAGAPIAVTDTWWMDRQAANNAFLFGPDGNQLALPDDYGYAGLQPILPSVLAMPMTPSTIGPTAMTEDHYRGLAWGLADGITWAATNASGKIKGYSKNNPFTDLDINFVEFFWADFLRNRVVWNDTASGHALGSGFNDANAISAPVCFFAAVANGTALARSQAYEDQFGSSIYDYLDDSVFNPNTVSWAMASYFNGLAKAGDVYNLYLLDESTIHGDIAPSQLSVNILHIDTAAGMTVNNRLLNIRDVLVNAGGTISTAWKDAVVTNSTVTIPAGTGTVTLPGTNTFPGRVQISAGKLALTGRLTAGSLTLASGATLECVPGTSSSALTVTGSLTLNGTLRVNDTGLGAGTYRLFNYSSSLATNGLTITLASGGKFVAKLDTSTSGQLNLRLQTPAGALSYIAGDFHQHTTYTDGNNPFATVMAKNDQFGLDWWANSEHGGKFNRNAAGPILTSGYDTGSYAQFLDTTGVTFLGNNLTTSGGHTNMWRWQSLRDLSFNDVLAARSLYPSKTLVQGVEWNVPGHEHCSVGIITDEFGPTATNANAIAQFEYLWDGNDADTSLGAKNTTNKHAKAVQAVAWMQANYPTTSWMVPAHPERKGVQAYPSTYTGTGEGYSAAAFRDLNNAGPSVFFGFESMPGHQKEGGRGGYATSASGGGTAGGCGYYSARVGGLWDALLGEGRGFWLFANSDFHNTANDFWPGEYQKTYTRTASGNAPQAIVDGLRSGDSFVVEGDLIDALDFNVNGAVMGSTITANGNTVTVSIRVHDPEGANNCPTNLPAGINTPALDHIDVIAGHFGPKIDPASPLYNVDTNGSTRVVARFAAAGGATDANGIVTTAWIDLGGGWKQMSLTYNTQGRSTYFRLRGTNKGVGEVGQTDAAGNPLVDPQGNTALDAWADLWFYSNPVFVHRESLGTVLRIASLSDLHYFATNLLVNNGPAFQTYIAQDRKLIAESVALTKAAVDAVLAQEPDIVLVSGDLTKDGELASHIGLSNELARLTAAGVRVCVVPGNHDVNSPAAVSYDGANTTPVPNVSPADFSAIYAPFGYGQALARDPGSLSYVVEPVTNLQILCMDSCEYGVTAGAFDASRLAWITNRLAMARAQGKVVIGMMHHGLLEHFPGQKTLFSEYVVDNYTNVAPLFASYGMRAVFTGHFHAQDVVKGTFGGNEIYDIETGSTVTWPCPYRIMELQPNGQLTINSQRISAINYNLGGAPDFQTYAYNYLTNGMLTLSAYMLQGAPFYLPAPNAAYVAPAVTEALVAHYAGDEPGLYGATPATQGIITTFLAGNAQSQQLGMGIASILTDTPPADNTLTLNIYTPPTVRLTAPANGAVVVRNQTVTLTATASDERLVTNMSFCVDGVIVGSDDSDPYQASWTPTLAGGYALTAVAWDNANQATTSAVVSVDVIPLVIVSPINGAIVAASTDRLTLDILSDGLVGQFRFRNVTAGSDVLVDASASTNASLALWYGLNTLTVSGTNAAGVAYADTITITRSAPTPAGGTDVLPDWDYNVASGAVHIAWTTNDGYQFQTTNACLPGTFLFRDPFGGTVEPGDGEPAALTSGATHFRYDASEGTRDLVVENDADLRVGIPLYDMPTLCLPRSHEVWVRISYWDAPGNPEWVQNWMLGVTLDSGSATTPELMGRARSGEGLITEAYTFTVTGDAGAIGLSFSADPTLSFLNPAYVSEITVDTRVTAPLRIASPVEGDSVDSSTEYATVSVASHGLVGMLTFRNETTGRAVMVPASRGRAQVALGYGLNVITVTGTDSQSRPVTATVTITRNAPSPANGTTIVPDWDYRAATGAVHVAWTTNDWYQLQRSNTCLPGTFQYRDPLGGTREPGAGEPDALTQGATSFRYDAHDGTRCAVVEQNWDLSFWVPCYGSSVAGVPMNQRVWLQVSYWDEPSNPEWIQDWDIAPYVPGSIVSTPMLMGRTHSADGLITEAYAFTVTGDASGFFLDLAANPELSALNPAYVSDVRVDVLAEPGILAHRILTTSEGLGTVSHANILVAHGSRTNIVLNAGEWLRIQSLTTNGATVAAAAATRSYTQELTNVTGDYHNHVVFSHRADTLNPSLDEGGHVPTAWLAQFGRGEAEPFVTSDRPIREKYLLNLTPYQTSEVQFDVEEFVINNGLVRTTVRMRVGGQSHPAVNGTLRLEGKVSLDDADWTPISGTSILGATFTNGRRTYEAVPAAGYRFFRVTVR